MHHIILWLYSTSNSNASAERSPCARSRSVSMATKRRGSSFDNKTSSHRNNPIPGSLTGLLWIRNNNILKNKLLWKVCPTFYWSSWDAERVCTGGGERGSFTGQTEENSPVDPVVESRVGSSRCRCRGSVHAESQLPPGNWGRAEVCRTPRLVPQLRGKPATAAHLHEQPRARAARGRAWLQLRS